VRGSIPERVIAGIFVLFGLRSLRKWMSRRFQAVSVGDQVLFSVYVSSRVGMWFALAGFFIGYAFVDEPQSLGWYVLVLIALSGVQLLSSFFLSRPRTGDPDGQDPEGIDKEGATSDPRVVQPEGSEVESARLLANQAREDLLAAGLTNEQIRTLADRFIAEHVGEGLPEFEAWARRQMGRSGPG